MVIDIGPDGGFSIKVEGVPGKKCLDITKTLEEAMGLVVSREKTTEFFEAEETARTGVSVGEKKE
jgi:hypothetical protein